MPPPLFYEHGLGYGTCAKIKSVFSLIAKCCDQLPADPLSSVCFVHHEIASPKCAMHCTLHPKSYGRITVVSCDLLSVHGKFCRKSFFCKIRIVAEPPMQKLLVCQRMILPVYPAVKSKDILLLLCFGISYLDRHTCIPLLYRHLEK